MALIDEMAIDNEYFIDDSLIKEVKNKIFNVKQFIKDNKIGQYFVVYVDFGEKLTQKDDLTPRKSDDIVSIKEMFKSKGYNCGFNEFRYLHMAVILSSIHHKYLLKRKDKHYSLLVAPISSSSKRVVNSIFLEKRLNNWLANDSYMLLDNITHISLERINLKETKELYKNNRTIPIQIVSEKVKEIKGKLKEMFDI